MNYSHTKSVKGYKINNFHIQHKFTLKHYNGNIIAEIGKTKGGELCVKILEIY